MSEATNNPDVRSGDDRLMEIAALMVQALLRLHQTREARDAGENTALRDAA